MEVEQIKSPLGKKVVVTLTEHGIQPDQAADEVVKIYVPSLIKVVLDDCVIESLIYIEPCCLKGPWEFITTNDFRTVNIKLFV